MISSDGHSMCRFPDCPAIFKNDGKDKTMNSRMNLLQLFLMLHAIEALYYSLQVNSLLRPCQAKRFKWNCSGKGKASNVCLYLDLEHDNKELKEEVMELK